MKTLVCDPTPTTNDRPAAPLRGEASQANSRDEFRLLKSLGPGAYGVAYAAVEPATGAVLEVRRLAANIAPVKLEELATRVRLTGMLWHSAARRVRSFESVGDARTLVLEGAAGTALDDWLDDSPTPIAVLRLLSNVADCLTESHHLGLTHGALDTRAIGVFDEAPQLDFTAFAASLADDSPVGSLEAKHQDCRSFAALLAELLERDDIAWTSGGVSHRELARLRNLAGRSADATSELPELVIFATCLRDLVESSAPAAELPVDKTCEVAIAPLADNLELTDGTVELSATPLVDTGTDEIGPACPLAGHAVLKLREPQVGDQLGRFRIEQKLGEGGMGSVFKAVDLGSNLTVAIKTLSQGAMLRGNALARFAKEARLLASLNNPHITNLIEVSEEEGIHFIALEFVRGVDVAKILKAQGRCAERTALAIAADVARALRDAHQRDIIHRDIKPENILLVDCDAHTPLVERSLQAKLADFGIARHVDQSESLAVTQAGSWLGTPRYMSPEQCKGQGDVQPAADVYSLGATLFELLTGQPPFSADDPMALAAKHCFEAPPDLRKFAADLSDPTVELVRKCLAKKPAERFADAGQLLAAIERILLGEPSVVSLRPVLPAHDAARVVTSSMTWRLKSAPEQLWPHVSNTERLNHAMGLPAVEYRTETDELGGVKRFGTIKLAGMSMSWQEHPFEWIEGRRMSVFREFTGGPFQWFVSTVELVPQAAPGCELRHTIKILPRNTMGRWIAGIETGAKCRRSLTKVYDRIDSLVGESASSNVVDLFTAAPKLSTAQQQRLNDRAAKLATTGVPAAACEKIVEFLTAAPEQEVAKIRPLALARRFNLNESELVDVCLHAVTQGLLTLRWDLLCPTCRVAAETRESLSQLEEHATCEACDAKFATDLADAVELVFGVAPDLRSAPSGRYCIGGPWHAPHVAAQLRLEPGERVEAELALEPGDYIVRGPGLSRTYPLRVVLTGAPSHEQLLLAPGADAERGLKLRAGGQALTLENRFEQRQIVRIERTIPRDDVLTAARASATPRFRELFPGEVFQSGRLVSAHRVTMLAVTIPSIDELYLSAGDAAAYSIVEQHTQSAEQIIRLQGGDLVKVVGEQLFASFASARSAAEAAFELVSTPPTNAAEQPIPLAVGVHQGPALVASANRRLDYFGATVRQAAALPLLTGPGVAISESVLADPDVAAWLAARADIGELRLVDLPGKPQLPVTCFRSAL